MNLNDNTQVLPDSETDDLSDIHYYSSFALKSG